MEYPQMRIPAHSTLFAQSAVRRILEAYDQGLEPRRLLHAVESAVSICVAAASEAAVEITTSKEAAVTLKMERQTAAAGLLLGELDWAHDPDVAYGWSHPSMFGTTHDATGALGLSCEMVRALTGAEAPSDVTSGSCPLRKPE